MSPENLDINISDKNLDETDDGDFKRSSEGKSSENEADNDRLSPMEKSDVLLRFNGCFKNRICSNCGRLDCNYLHCRMTSDSMIKDNKPVLKFSVSAILGNEQPSRTVQNGKCLDTFSASGDMAGYFNTLK